MPTYVTCMFTYVTCKTGRDRETLNPKPQTCRGKRLSHRRARNILQQRCDGRRNLSKSHKHTHTHTIRSVAHARTHARGNARMHEREPTQREGQALTSTLYRRKRPGAEHVPGHNATMHANTHTHTHTHTHTRGGAQRCRCVSCHNAAMRVRARARAHTHNVTAPLWAWHLAG